MSILAVKLPDVGEGVTEAELAEWAVNVGDIIREDDTIAAVMTDKATVEIPSLYSGKVVKLGGEIGDVLAVGSDLILIETDQTAQPEAAPPNPPAKPKSQDPQPSTPRDLTPPPVAPRPVQQTGAPRPENTKPIASPAIRARARDGGVDLRQVSGTGPAGRITHTDLDAVFAAHSSHSPKLRMPKNHAEEIKVIGLRRKIAERMSAANARIPHITVVEEIDVTELEATRSKLNADRGERPKLTLLPLIIKALEKAVSDHPEINAHYDDDAGIITQHKAVHAGIATMTDAGLMVPVLHHSETLGLFDLAQEISRLSDAARSAQAKRDELSGSTITITSLGPLGAIATTPIINAPEVAIVGINKIAIRPMWDGTQFLPRKMMNLSASFDHRVIDGWNAAVFVQKMKTLLESPALIFVEA